MSPSRDGRVAEDADSTSGIVVKMLGDGVHFHFQVPNDAVMASLEIVDTVHPAGLPPAHVGVNAGPMIYDEGDYLAGRSTSRPESRRRRGRTRCSSERDVLRLITPSGFQLVEVGAFELRGIADPLTLYQVVRDGDP